MDSPARIVLLEARAFALWKVDVTPEYKRLILTELFRLIKRHPNETTNRLFKRLSRICFNVTRVELDCAIASLRLFDLVDIFKIPQNNGEEIQHVNCKRRNLRVWKLYLRHIRQYQPVAVV